MAYLDLLPLLLLGSACFSKHSSQYSPLSSTWLGCHLILPEAVIMLSRLPQSTQTDRRLVFVFLEPMSVHLAGSRNDHILRSLLQELWLHNTEEMTIRQPLSTRLSPTRWVSFCESRYSRIGTANLREVLAMSRNSATTISFFSCRNFTRSALIDSRTALSM